MAEIVEQESCAKEQDVLFWVTASVITEEWMVAVEVEEVIRKGQWIEFP